MKLTPFLRAVVGLAVLSAAIAAGASGAGGRFLEANVRVPHQFDGAGPAAAAVSGWAGTDLGGADADDPTAAIVGEPGNGPAAATGSTYVFSSRTGRLI